MTDPISPDDIESLKFKDIPDAVFQAFNELITEKFRASSGSATVYQDHVLDRIVSIDPSLSRSTLFANNQLDVEPYYREQGWEVEYDKPAYNETYKAYFIFSKGKN